METLLGIILEIIVKRMVLLAVVETVVIVVVVVGVVVFALYSFFTRSGPSGTPTVIRIRHDPDIPAGVAVKKEVTVIITRETDGNGVPLIDVLFKILPGNDGRISSNIEGKTSIQKTTNTFGEASVEISGNQEGSDILQFSLPGKKPDTLPYETLAQ